MRYLAHAAAALEARDWHHAMWMDAATEQPVASVAAPSLLALVVDSHIATITLLRAIIAQEKPAITASKNTAEAHAY